MHENNSGDIIHYYPLGKERKERGRGWKGRNRGKKEE